MHRPFYPVRQIKKGKEYKEVKEKKYCRKKQSVFSSKQELKKVDANQNLK
jgi:hypothetical protein